MNSTLQRPSSRSTLSAIYRILFIIVQWFLLGVTASFCLTGSLMKPLDTSEKARRYTRAIEFNYANWTLDALELKFSQAALNLAVYLPPARASNAVRDYIQNTRRLQELNSLIQGVYADPQITDKEGSSAGLRAERDELTQHMDLLAPAAETILQSQVSQVLASQGLAVGGQPLPPVLYHITGMPKALIVSPRSTIRQDANVSLIANLEMEDIVQLEQNIESDLDVSALVVDIGGVGVYPTMVMRTSDLSWLAEVVAHEWTHNYLTLRPLGFNYDSSPEMRTLNETVASLVGKEIGRMVLEQYYPELVPPPTPTASAEEEDSAPQATPPSEPEPAVFNFREEMRVTRVEADRLLAEGKIDEAENWMEQRRQVFVAQGYVLRRLNQAYFAFYGAYNDTPGGGASGVDPVGPAVQALRAQSASLAEFLNRVAGVASFEELQAMVQTQ